MRQETLPKAQNIALRMLLLLIPSFSKEGYSRGCRWEIYIAESYYSLPASAGLGQGLPEVKPSTSEPLPARLKELAGKLGWMKWEPPLRMPLSEGRRSRMRADEFRGAGSAPPTVNVYVTKPRIIINGEEIKTNWKFVSGNALENLWLKSSEHIKTLYSSNWTSS